MQQSEKVVVVAVKAAETAVAQGNPEVKETVELAAVQVARGKGLL